MHGSRKRKFELVLPRVEAMRALAECTARAASGELVIGGQTVALDDCSSLKIGVKHFGASSMLKVSLRYPARGTQALPTPAGLDADDAVRADAAESVVPGGKIRYKSLKKRMKQSFRALVAALRDRQAPDPAVLAAFVADSRLMVTYSGKGDAFYPAYDAEVDRLEAAAAAADLDAMTASVAALDRMKKECHSRHA
jgi:XXXCH domain-containing protein